MGLYSYAVTARDGAAGLCWRAVAQGWILDIPMLAKDPPADEAGAHRRGEDSAHEPELTIIGRSRARRESTVDRTYVAGEWS